MSNIYSILVLLLLSLGVAFMVNVIIRKHLCALLNEVIKSSPATEFYLRAFSLLLIFTALAGSLKYEIIQQAQFMEYVWKVAGRLGEVLGSISLFLLAYVALITIVLVVLKRKNEQ